MKNQKKGLYWLMAASVMALVVVLAAACNASGVTSKGQGDGLYTVVLKDAAADNMTAVPPKAAKGTEVILSMNADKGYVSALSAGGDVLLTHVKHGVWSFIMPAANVEIEASFSSTPSTDASLSALSSSTGTWDDSFAPETILYGIEIESHVTSVAFDFTTTFIDADVAGDQALDVSGDSAQAEFVVTAQDGSTKTYTVVVFKMPNAVLDKVTVSGTGSGYTLDGFDTAITSTFIAPMLPFAQGKDTVAITYTAAFLTRNTDSAVTVVFDGGSDFTFTGGTTAVTLNFNDSRSGTFEVSASKMIAGKARVSTKTYTLTLERSEMNYPQASEAMAKGGQVITVKTGAGKYDIVHIFFYDPQNNANGQTEGTFTVNVPIANAQVLVLAGGGAGGIGSSASSWFGAGGGAGGLSYQQNASLSPGTIAVKTGAGGTGTTGNRGQSGFDSVFGGVTVAGGGGGAFGQTGKLGNGADGGSGGGGTGAYVGGAVIDPAYGFAGGNGTGWSDAGGGRSYGGGGGGAGGAGKAAAQADHSGKNSQGGIGKTWEQLGNAVSSAMLSVPDTLFGLAGGGNGVRSSTERLIDEGPGYGSGLGHTFATNPDHNAIANTGSGGGCGNGAGASGVVIVRYTYVQPGDR